ncbi:MAG TPA: class I SAM-dependent methyltransferase [Chitinophagaceae bacterium]|nr:class I SAM-dependent methyltransferase [Chitinophagaceae bacterium]
MDTNSIQEQIKKFWNENPVGTNFINDKVGKQFFLDYDAIRYRMEGHILEEINSISWKHKKVLEIGLGQGSDSMQIVLNGGIYSGIDITEESIHRLKERFAIFNLPYSDLLLADARKIPFEDGTFDIVFTHGVIHHSPHMAQIINEVHRVLKPGGKAVMMVYHKSSVNYWMNIFTIRRVGLLAIRVFQPAIKLISKLTGESVDRITKHRESFKKQGFNYLKMKNFIHKSTDGPDNIYSTVWTQKSILPLLSSFSKIDFKVHYLNERHLMGLQHILPASFKKYLSRKFGWHLWVYAQK